MSDHLYIKIREGFRHNTGLQVILMGLTNIFSANATRMSNATQDINFILKK